MTYSRGSALLTQCPKLGRRARQTVRPTVVKMELEQPDMIVFTKDFLERGKPVGLGKHAPINTPVKA